MDQKRLFANAVLRGVQNVAGGTHGRELGGSLGRGSGNIFELECDDADAPSEAAHLVQVVVGGDYFEIGHLARGRVGIGRKCVDAVAHAPRGDGEHAAQLAAAQHANRGSGKNRLDHESVSLRTRSVCAARQARSFSRSSGLWAESAATAKRAALMAPALPIAKVATGTPPGI